MGAVTSAIMNAGVRKAFDALSGLPTASAYKAHIDFLRDKYSHAEEEIAKLEKENLDLLRENKGIKDSLSKAEKKLAELEFQTVLADIGPCRVKVDINREILPGFYCPKCNLQLDRGDYSPWGKDALVCQACSTVRLQGKDVDTARAAFIQRLLKKSS